MRDNSGGGKASNNNHDPTLKEHAAEGSHHAARPVPGDAAQIGGNAGVVGETRSPGARGRGETSAGDKAPPVDIAGR
jgi:hypothetical protein